MVVGVGPDGGGDGDDGGGADGGCPIPASFASSIPMRTLSASFSSRARRAMSLTASNSSRLTRLRSRSQRSAWVLNMVSNSRLTPCATPAASFIRRATSSKKRLLVWVMVSLNSFTALYEMALRPSRNKIVLALAPSNPQAGLMLEPQRHVVDRQEESNSSKDAPQPNG